ncbi:MAG: glycosyltransferase [Kiloniellales bacterium]
MSGPGSAAAGEAPPLVGIGLPVYNGAATLRRALDSLVAQDWPRLSIVIADDCSSDASAEICRDYAARHCFIRFIQNPSNLGSVDNLRLVVAETPGDYFLYASQDDVWAPSFVSRLVRELEADRGAVAAMCATRSLRPDGEEIGVTRLMEPDWPQRRSPLGNALSIVTKRGRAARPVKNNMFIHGIVRAHVFRELLRSFPEIFVAERQLVCQMALAGRLVYVDEVLFTKQVAWERLAERRPDDPLVRKKAEARFPNLLYIQGLTGPLLRSRIVPWYRKAFIPAIVGAFFWAGVLPRWRGRFLRMTRDNLPGSVFALLQRLRGRGA